MFPGPYPVRANEHRARARGVKCLLQRFLPGIARNQVPFVEKGLQRDLIFKTACDDFHIVFISASMRQEDIIETVACHGGHPLSTFHAGDRTSKRPYYRS